MVRAVAIEEGGNEEEAKEAEVIVARRGWRRGVAARIVVRVVARVVAVVRRRKRRWRWLARVTNLGALLLHLDRARRLRLPFGLLRSLPLRSLRLRCRLRCCRRLCRRLRRGRRLCRRLGLEFGPGLRTGSGLGLLHMA